MASLFHRYINFLVLSFLCCMTQMAVAQQRADSTLMQYLIGEGLNRYEADDVRYYTNGHDKFEALLDDIDHAKRRIWIEYFIFANDSIGTLVMDHLVQAARRGCDVRVVTDYYKDRERHFGMGSPAYADSLARLGVDFQMFDRFKMIWFTNIARDHRKVVNIDDEIGYIGGLNIADYYIHGDPSYGGWRDTHARITGPAVEGLARLFHKQYAASGGRQGFSFKPYHRNLGETRIADVVYFERSRENRQKKAETRNALIAAFDAARDTIRLVTPYLMPTHTLRQAMIRALDRGVHMEILFSKIGDIDLVSGGNYHFSLRLLRHGAHIYLYKGDFHHSKIMMVDGQFCMVGSANLNSRSLKWDYEASAFIFGAEPTQKLTAIFENDKLRCDTLSREYYKSNFSRSFRFKGWFADRFFTPIF